MTYGPNAAPLPLSVSLMPSGPVGQVVELARWAEDRGIGRCWVYDEGLVTRDVYVTLTAIAAATSSIRLGPGITNPYVRHPGATVSAIATLDEFSGGRAFLGLGAGGGLTLGPLGIERRRPVQAVADMVGVVRGLLAGEEVSHEGPVFSLRSARLSFGRPDLEIIMAGRGPRMLALGGAVADGFTLSYLYKPFLGRAVTALRDAHATAASGRPFTVVYATLVATTEQDLEQARAQLSFRLVDSPPEVRDAIGMTDDDVASIRSALAGGGPTAAARFVRPEWVPHFVIAGSAEECGRELRQLMATHGIDEFQLPVSHLDDGAAAIERAASLFAPRPQNPEISRPNRAQHGQDAKFRLEGTGEDQ